MPLNVEFDITTAEKLAMAPPNVAAVEEETEEPDMVAVLIDQTAPPAPVVAWTVRKVESDTATVPWAEEMAPPAPEEAFANVHLALTLTDSCPEIAPPCRQQKNLRISVAPSRGCAVFRVSES